MDAWEYTEADRDRITQFLGSPLEFPAEFKKWIIDHVGMNLPPIPIEQLQGYIQTRAYGDSLAGSVQTSLTTYQDLGGPEVTGLPDGTYVVLHGSKIGGSWGRMALSVNGGAGADADSVYVEVGGSITYAGARGKKVVLSAGAGGNSILTVFRKDSGGSPGDAVFSQPWLSVVRMS